MKTKKTGEKPRDTTLNTNGSNGSKAPRDEVATCAYLIWEQEGRPDGCAEQHWLEAERQLEATHE